MNSNICTYVTEILKAFGEYCDQFDLDTKYEPYVRNIKYGLEIRKYYKTKNIIIKYNGVTVYNEQEKIYKHGVWEEVIEEYYTKIPSILKNSQKEKEIKKNNDNLYNRISGIMLLGNKEKYHEVEENYSYYHDYSIFWFENGLKIVVDDYVSIKHLVTTKVFYNNEEVFCRVKEHLYDNNISIDNVTYPVCLDGEWLDLIASLEDKKNKEKVLKINNNKTR